MKTLTKTLLATVAGAALLIGGGAYFTANADSHGQGYEQGEGEGYGKRKGDKDCDERGEKRGKKRGEKRGEKRNLDIDGDGLVSLEEFMNGNEGPFRFDANNDGVLEASDFEAANSRRAAKMLEQVMQNLDDNGDQKVTKAEFDAHREARFYSLDANDDGKLDREEMEEMGRGH